MSRKGPIVLMAITTFAAIPWRWILHFLIALLRLLARYFPNKKSKP